MPRVKARATCLYRSRLVSSCRETVTNTTPYGKSPAGQSYSPVQIRYDARTTALSSHRSGKGQYPCFAANKADWGESRIQGTAKGRNESITPSVSNIELRKSALPKTPIQQQCWWSFSILTKEAIAQNTL